MFSAILLTTRRLKCCQSTSRTVLHVRVANLWTPAFTISIRTASQARSFSWLILSRGIELDGLMIMFLCLWMALASIICTSLGLTWPLPFDDELDAIIGNWSSSISKQYWNCTGIKWLAANCVKCVKKVCKRVYLFFQCVSPPLRLGMQKSTCASK